jgi:hypothetical protein
MTPNHSQTRAARLLARILETQWFDEKMLAAELVLSVDELRGYAEGRAVMPLNRQLALALFAIEKAPAFARFGHQLKAQVAAAFAYAGHETATHASPPERSYFGR